MGTGETLCVRGVLMGRYCLQTGANKYYHQIGRAWGSPWWLSFLILTSVLPGKDLYIISSLCPNLYFELVNASRSICLLNWPIVNVGMIPIKKHFHDHMKAVKLIAEREAKSVEKICSYGFGQSSKELNWSLFYFFRTPYSVTSEFDRWHLNEKRITTFLDGWLLNSISF